MVFETTAKRSLIVRTHVYINSYSIIIYKKNNKYYFNKQAAAWREKEEEGEEEELNSKFLVVKK